MFSLLRRKDFSGGFVFVDYAIIFTHNPIFNAMFSLRKFFRPSPFHLAVSKDEKEMLACFLAYKTEYEFWNQDYQPDKIQFRFYFPTAIDFIYDGAKLFTAYFKKTANDTLELQELKMSKSNFASIRSTNWKPFEEIIVLFLNTLEEKKKTTYLQKTKALREYVSMCEEIHPADRAA